MSKRFKDDRGESEPIILTPDSAVHLNPHDPRSHGRGSHGGPTPLSVEETVEVLGELDKLSGQVEGLTARIGELTRELDSKDREIAQLRARDVADAGPAEAVAPAAGEAGNGEAKDQEIAELKDKYLRALAEHENARRRIRQQSDDSVRLQKENLLRELLPIVDNLERAVEAAKGKGDGRSIIEGVQMVLASLMDFLKSNGVRPITSVGEQFDPNRHEAADHVPHSSHAANTVVGEFHRGYTINDKVLRPARVVVSKGDGNGTRT
jgi:molecular chaperone GrpE